MAKGKQICRLWGAILSEESLGEEEGVLEAEVVKMVVDCLPQQSRYRGAGRRHAEASKVGQAVRLVVIRDATDDGP